MKFRLPNPDNNDWISKCNLIIEQYENNVQLKPKDENYVKYSCHHILPRSEYPEYTNNKDNMLFLPVEDHINLHYYMWKGNSKYASAFWFCYVWFHKNFGYTITDAEYEQLKRDIQIYRKLNKSKKNKHQLQK